MKEIRIIGAGLCGLLCAIKLANKGYLVTIYEQKNLEDILNYQKATHKKSGRSMSMDLSARGLLALKDLNLLEKFLPVSVIMKNKIFHHQDNSLDIVPYGKNHNEYILTVSRNQLFEILYKKAILYNNIKINFSSKLTTINRLENNIIIGADGVNSQVRELIFKDTSKKTSLSKCYKELTISAPNNLDINAMHIWPRNGFMLVAQPNFDGTFTSALITEKNMTISNIKKFFKEYFFDIYESMPNLMQEFTNNKISEFNIVNCDKIIAGNNILLMGDAAHAMVPFLGQGVNCSFEDCSVLLECLDKCDNDWPKAISLYEEKRLKNIQAINKLSLENYPELEFNADIKKCILEKQLDIYLMKKYTQKYLSFHNLICFNHTEYKKILALKNIQTNLIKNLSKDIYNLADLKEHKIHEEFMNYEEILRQIEFDSPA